MGAAEFNQKAQAAYHAMDEDEKIRMAPIWKEAYDAKHSFEAAVGDSSATARGESLALYMRKVSKQISVLVSVLFSSFGHFANIF